MTEFHGDFKSMSDKEKDEVINPKHYKIIPPGDYPDGIEYIDVCRYAFGHLRGIEAIAAGQILKYLLRLGKKDDTLQDASKIVWYAQYLVDQLEEINPHKSNLEIEKEKKI